MTPDNFPSFYDVQPLANWLQAGIPVITPNYRLARHIKLAWAKQRREAGIHTWETPLVMSIEHWWLHCRTLADPWGEATVQLASEAQELELWHRCVRENPGSSALLRPRGAARLALDAYRTLLLWQLDRHTEPLASEFRLSADAALFLEWAQRFEQLCARLNLALLPMQVPELAQKTPIASVVLAEMDELPPLYEQALRSQVGVIHRHQHRAGMAAPSLQPCQDREQELYGAARWALRALRDDPGTSVAILLPDLATQRHRFERILREVFTTAAGEDARPPVNFSGGVPLATVPVVRTALDLLSLQATEIEVETLLPLLHSRYRAAGEREQELALLRTLYRHGRAVISASQLRYACRDLALGAQLLQLSCQRELRQSHTPSVWSEALSQCLATLQWPGPGSLNSQEYQQLQHWYQCLEKMAELDRVYEKIDYRAACKLLRQLCTDTVFQVQTTDAPIQVLGLLEAAGLQFQYLWLSAMSSSDWPPPARPNPFIPFGLQRQYGLPHADSRREHQYAQRLLDQYRHGCTQLVASYALVKDSIEQRPSPLLQDFTRLPPLATGQYPAAWAATAGLPMEQLALEDRAPAMNDDEIAALRGGSGLIKDQSHCGFRAFAHNRLLAREPGELALGLTPADRGNMVHNALYELWGKLGDSETLHTLAGDARQALVAEVVTSTLGAFITRHPDLVGNVYLGLEDTYLQRLLRAWLDVEAQRSAFVVQAREAGCELQLGKLQLQLRVDRIDLLPNGEQLVIDYKSGATDIRDWLGPRPKEPQLPLYTEALGPGVGGVSYAAVKPDEACWQGLAREDLAPGISSDISRASAAQEATLADWEALREAWQASLQDLAQQFIDGHARVDPLDRSISCRWCGLQPLCRIEEAGNHGGH